MKRFAVLPIMLLLSIATIFAADPTATTYSWNECQGSLRPYPAVKTRVAYPDTLVPVLVNHVGRHGSRFPASSANCLKLRAALVKAESEGTITRAGRNLLKITDYVIAKSNDRWGALDSLGMAEQRGIASRMMQDFPPVFSEGAVVNAISSYSPRVMMSMYSFTHQMDRLNNRLEFVTGTGRMYSPLLRPFDIDEDYLELRRGNTLTEPYQQYFAKNCPTAPIERVLGEKYPFESKEERQDLSLTEYYVLAGMSAMELTCDVREFLTPEEQNALWSCFNLRQYLQRTASTVSSVPAEIAAKLLDNLITTTQDATEGKNTANVYLRFGHAETLMPLFSLMHLPGCYYLTNYFDTVGLHWCDFRVVPMAANLQMILFRNPKSGRYYLRTDLNEQPIALIPNSQSLYVPWDEARTYLTRCLPLYMQI